jgi:hypothetical protein
MRRAITTLAAMLLALSMMVVPGVAETVSTASASDTAGQCEGFDSPAKIDVEDFVDGVATWYGVPADDGKTYDVIGTLSADGKSITFQIVGAPAGSTLDFCLKGGSDNQEGPQYFDGVLSGGLVRDISNVVVYRIHVPDNGNGGDQWCSPGFWRNSPLQAAAAAATADLSFLPDGVSYLDVLNSPETYGGELFNLVGDALSRAAGLEFDERAEDSCPFSADASEKPKPAPVAKGGKK